MCRPFTRALFGLSCATLLLIAPGCSLFRAEVADSYLSAPTRHLPAIDELADSPPPPADPLAAGPVPAAAETAPPRTTLAAARSSAPLPLAGGNVANAPDEPAAAEPESCYIEIHEAGKEPERLRMLLEDAPYVQKVLTQTGLIKRFRKMDIQLSRQLPDGGRHKLDIRYDRKSKRVQSAFDYALHADDLLVIRENTESSFDEMLKKLAGPLGR